MKILKDPKTAWSIQISCGRCSALLEIVDTDVYMAELGSAEGTPAWTAFREGEQRAVLSAQDGEE